MNKNEKNEITTECELCGSHINAGTFPPFCSQMCHDMAKIEHDFERFARQNNK